MLIENKPVIGDVVCIKLSNGDEIIAKYADHTETSLVVTKPMLMVLSQDPRTGQPGVQMAPFWIMGGEPTARFPIAHTHIVCMVKSNSEAKSSYTAQTSSLTIPNSGLIV